MKKYRDNVMIDKKELRNEYKRTPRPMGVYKIQNLANGKIFVGGSLNIPGKINSHQFQLKFRCHINKELQRDYDTYGEKNFVYDVLEYLKPNEDISFDYKDDLQTLEELWIEQLNPFGEKGYNKKKFTNPLKT